MITYLKDSTLIREAVADNVFISFFLFVLGFFYISFKFQISIWQGASNNESMTLSNE